MPLWFYGDSPRKVVHTLTDTKNGTNSATANLGAAFAGRVIIVAAVYGGAAASGATCAGNAMTSIASGGARAQIFAIVDSVNTSATITLTGASAISSFTVYSLSGVSGITAFDSGGNSTQTININIAANGAAIAAGGSNNATSGYTFSGVTTDNSYNSGSSGGGQGSAEFTDAVTPQTISFTSAGAIFGIAAASWQPG